MPLSGYRAPSPGDPTGRETCPTVITMTDLFCGAGGSSSGAEQVPGVTVRMAANHWNLAIETHNTNLPHADHDCADISQVDPRRYPRTDLLWVSPECTNHSQARGKRRIEQADDLFSEQLPDEAAERSRATMWDVIRFAEHHRYRAVLVENVVDAYHWAPFQAWLAAMHSLGYEHQIAWLNSMHAQAAGLPAPQSRDRMYVIFHRRGDTRPDVRRWTSPRAWCPACEAEVAAVQTFKRSDRPAWGRYRQQYLYRCPNAACRNTVVEPGWLPAAAAIDWSLPGERIGDRKRQLAAKTRARIAAGLEKFARPITLEAAGHTFERRPGVRTWPVDGPLMTQHTTASKGVASAEPFLMRHYTPRGQLAQMSTSVAATSPTLTVSSTPALVVPVEGREGKVAASAGAPLRTQTARAETALVVPLRTHGTAGPVAEPLRTCVAGNVGQALVLPMRQNNVVKDAGVEPLDTVAAAGNHHALIMRNNGSVGDGGEHCTSPAEPVRTLTAAGHQSVVRWDHLLLDYNGPAQPVTGPMRTQTTVEGDGLLGPAVAVDDCYFRMLEPHEIKAAMAFAADYVLLGNKRERVRLAGNAVTPPAARDLIASVVEALGGAELASA